MTARGVPLSIVVPAYNEAARISHTLVRTLDYLRAHHAPESEVLVVDDGSTDGTAALVAGLGRSDPRLKLLRFERNRGKGAAVREGVLAARCDPVLFMDADLSTPVEEVAKLLLHLADGADIVIGSRGLPSSDIRAHQPAARELMGRTFNLIVRAAVLGGIRDTQCGFKLFRRAVARDLFERQTTDGFAFDVEILLHARQAGHRIHEVPVIWSHAPNSKVSMLTDALRMFSDVVRLRRVHGRAP